MGTRGPVGAEVLTEHKAARLAKEEIHPFKKRNCIYIFTIRGITFSRFVFRKLGDINTTMEAYQAWLKWIQSLKDFHDINYYGLV